jgi:endonuclease/exonuclease/phosphatase family metal-dependent hydrolase
VRLEREAAGFNEFQKKLSFDEIYSKNDSLTLKNIEDYNQLRILSWNVERGGNPHALAAYINQVEPDIVCLQEVDWGNERTKKADVLDVIARSTSMTGFFGTEFLEIQTPSRAKELAGGGVQGNAILTRILPRKCFRIELPVVFDWVNPPEHKKLIAQREKRIGARFALGVEFNYFGRTIVICSTHLEDKDGGVAGRFAQFQSLAETIRTITTESGTSIIAGDFNSLENWITFVTSTYQTSTSLKKPWYVSECRWWKERLLPQTGYIDPFTCKNWTYKRSMIYREKLDWIAVRNCHVLKQGVGDFNTSDHRPLWTQISVNT